MATPPDWPATFLDRVGCLLRDSAWSKRTAPRGLTRFTSPRRVSPSAVRLLPGSATGLALMCARPRLRSPRARRRPSHFLSPDHQWSALPCLHSCLHTPSLWRPCPQGSSHVLMLPFILSAPPTLLPLRKRTLRLLALIVERPRPPHLRWIPLPRLNCHLPWALMIPP